MNPSKWSGYRYALIATAISTVLASPGCTSQAELAKQKAASRLAGASEERSRLIPQVSSLESQTKRLEEELARAREDAKRIEQQALETGRLQGREEKAKEIEDKVDALRRENETKIASLESKLKIETAREVAAAAASGEQAGYVRGAAEAREAAQITMEEKLEQLGAKRDLEQSQEVAQAVATTTRQVRTETMLRNNATTWAIIAAALSLSLALIVFGLVWLGRVDRRKHNEFFTILHDQLDKRERALLVTICQLTGNAPGQWKLGAADEPDADTDGFGTGASA